MSNEEREGVPINPDVCAVCEYYWEFDYMNAPGDERYWDLSCVNNSYYNAFGNHWRTCFPTVINHNDFQATKQAFFGCFGYNSEEITSGAITAVTFKPEYITDDLRAVCKNVVIFQNSGCPYFLEHKLKDLNDEP